MDWLSFGAGFAVACVCWCVWLGTRRACKRDEAVIRTARYMEGFDAGVASERAKKA